MATHTIEATPMDVRHTLADLKFTPIEEAAEFVGLPPRTIRDMARRGLVTCLNFEEMLVSLPDLILVIESAIVPARPDALSIYRQADAMLDPVQAFLDGQTEPAPSHRLPFRALYVRYLDWARVADTDPLGPKKFGSLLKDVGYPTRKIGGTTYKIGLRLVGDRQAGQPAESA